MAERKDPPTYEPGKGGPKSHDDAGQKPHSPGKSDQAPGHNKPEPKSQKSEIAQFYRSQGRQPDDVIHEVGGMKLTLRDLDG